MEVPPPDTMGQTFDLLARQGVLNIELAGSLKKAVGFRNIAVHSYESINWDIVHSIAKFHLAGIWRNKQNPRSVADRNLVLSRFRVNDTSLIESISGRIYSNKKSRAGHVWQESNDI